MRRALVILVTILSGAVLMSLPGHAQERQGEGLFREGAPEIKGPKAAALRQLPDFSALSKAVSGAVVNIAVEGGPPIDDDDDGDSALPFPLKPQQDSPSRSTGSGFILSPDGFIATSNHVVDKSEKIIVRLLNDKTEYTATVVGKDPKTDVALLKIDSGKVLPFVFLGNSDDIEVGEWVMAIGNQFELGQTVTVGIVSAQGRRVPSSGGSPYDTYIQTDASINPGSSGGPLVNVRGQVIGINTAIFTPSRRTLNEAGFNIGIGFAVPINTIKHVLPELKNKGRITRGLLGVIIQQVDPDVAQALGLPSPEGALVADVMPDSPARRAGFERKDVVVKFNGRKIDDYNQLPILVADTPVGSSVDVEVIRDKKPRMLKVVIEELRDEKAVKKEQPLVVEEIGVAVEEHPIRVRSGATVASSKKVTIERILPNSVAEKAGFLPKDRVLEFGGAKITSAAQFKEMVEKLESNRPVLVLVQRNKSTRFVALRLQ